MSEAPPAEVAAGWMAAMRRGDWAGAWRQSDRLELPRRSAQRRPGFVRGPHHLCWDGTSFHGRSVLLRCEHGLGDTLQFMRFVPQVTRIAREMHVMVQPALLPLFAGAPELGHVHNGWTEWWPPPPHEVEAEIMELPYALRVTLDTLPAPYPHLKQRVVAHRPPPLPHDGKLHVGLLWAASDWDPSRSVPLHALEPLLRVPGVRFFSLQQGEPGADPALERLGIERLSPHTRDVAAAGAALLQLDLLVTVDNMLAHLAGTLGSPTWLLLKRHADWRWMDGCADSPWYPGMRLFRQPVEGDWDGAVAAMLPALRAMAAGRSLPPPA